jgi:hypothetical protein
VSYSKRVLRVVGIYRNVDGILAVSVVAVLVILLVVLLIPHIIFIIWTIDIFSSSRAIISASTNRTLS